jgi:acyl carrier protein
MSRHKSASHRSMPESSSSPTLQTIAEIARQRFDRAAVISGETRLVEDLGLDSLKALEMIIEIENRFEIRIDETSEHEIVTVGDLVKVIDQAVAAARERDR